MAAQRAGCRTAVRCHSISILSALRLARGLIEGTRSHERKVAPGAEPAEADPRGVELCGLGGGPPDDLMPNTCKTLQWSSSVESARISLRTHILDVLDGAWERVGRSLAVIGINDRDAKLVRELTTEVDVGA